MYVYDARTYSLYKCTLLKRCLAARAASRRSVLCLRCVHVLYRRKDLWLCVCICMYTCFRIASAGFSRSRPLPGLRGNGIKCSSFALSCTIIRAPTGCAFIFREKPLDFIRLARGNMQQRVVSLCNNRLLSLLSLTLFLLGKRNLLYSCVHICTAVCVGCLSKNKLCIIVIYIFKDSALFPRR